MISKRCGKVIYLTDTLYRFRDCVNDMTLKYNKENFHFIKILNNKNSNNIA